MARLDHIAQEREVFTVVELAIFKVTAEVMQELYGEINVVRNLGGLPELDVPTSRDLLGRVKETLRRRA